MRRLLDTFHRDRDGAVLFLMLAAVMILMLMAWMIVDLTMAANHKVEAQATADVSALSHSAVKARSMNMMAYANVSKRSVFLIHSTYIAHFMAFAQWSQIIEGIGRTLCCVSTGELDFACTLQNVGYQSMKMWEFEARDDFASFAGADVDFSTSIDADGDQSTGVGGEHADYLNHQAPGCGDVTGSGLILGTSHFNDAINTVVGSFFEIVMDILGEIASGGDVGAYVQSAIDQVLIEVSDDLRGILFGLDNLRPIEDWAGLTRNYYAEDLKAMDNYQRYLAGMTPWWAWSESLTRALRNGAATAGASPRPPGMRLSTEDLATRLSDTLGMNVELDRSDYTDTLPVRPGIGPRSYWSPGGKPKGMHDADYMYKSIPQQTSFLQQSLGDNIVDMIGIGGEPNTDFVDDPLFYEHMTNLLLSALSSTYVEGDLLASAALGVLITSRTHNMLIGRNAAGSSTTLTGEEIVGTLEFSQELFEDQLGAFTVNPWLVNRYRSEAEWLANSSNIVFAYSYPHGGADPHEQRAKYEVVQSGDGPGSGLGFVGQIVGDSIYKTTGYWGMARSEISYQGSDDNQPNLWEPVWTARLRPVALPGEADHTVYRMSGAFHDAVSTMGLARLVGVTDFQMVGQAVIDFLHMERSTRAMGESTVEGVAK